MTLADFYTFYTFGLAGMISNKVLELDLLAGRDNIAELLARLAEHPSIAQVEADK